MGLRISGAGIIEKNIMIQNVAIAGRFQPFHWGHFEYIIAASRFSKNLVIGITNPDAYSVYCHKSNLSRSLPESNPFSFEERCQMILQTMEIQAPHLVIEFRKCIFGDSKTLRQSMGNVSIVALTVYDDWSYHRIKLFKEAGYAVEILWERIDRITTGTEVRERLRIGAPWRHLVPPGCADVIEEIISKRRHF